MTTEEKRELERIRADRKGVVDSELFPGLKQLLSQFYPDKNHFIYELLQNAEDAGASNVRFEVMPDKLLFVHNGSEPFSIKHMVVYYFEGYKPTIKMISINSWALEEAKKNLYRR